MLKRECEELKVSTHPSLLEVESVGEIRTRKSLRISTDLSCTVRSNNFTAVWSVSALDWAPGSSSKAVITLEILRQVSKLSEKTIIFCERLDHLDYLENILAEYL